MPSISITGLTYRYMATNYEPGSLLLRVLIPHDGVRLKQRVHNAVTYNRQTPYGFDIYMFQEAIDTPRCRRVFISHIEVLQVRVLHLGF